ncbi:morphogenic membrane protein MmpB [Streptomyces aureoversilis]|uniref:Morphogenic membrane protein MmpB n=1 Tax=Streptomyces aureoversilis TaxID=67277 RepID=A0ABW0A8D5_9ACTN
MLRSDPPDDSLDDLREAQRMLRRAGVVLAVSVAVPFVVLDMP